MTHSRWIKQNIQHESFVASATNRAPLLSRQKVLTFRQRRALRLHAIGCPDKVIAIRVGVSERTVRFHIAEAIKRLGAQSRSHAVAIALGRGEIGRPPILGGARGAR